MEQSDVLIVGAGPTGLVLALWLTKAGTKVRIVDKTAGPGPPRHARLRCRRAHSNSIGSLTSLTP
jgi:2-polyprenyl-6-methoxyphenol hydroxylase-like FAD-dependent oxidoreductase